jgi:hypothetical protein
LRRKPGRHGFLKVIESIKFKLMQRLILLAIIGVLIFSCKRMPDEVSEFSTLRLVWNDDPSTTMAIIWDGMGGRNAAVYYDTIDHEREYWKYAQYQSPYRMLEFHEMNTQYTKLVGLRSGQHRTGRSLLRLWQGEIPKAKMRCLRPAVPQTGWWQN